VDYLAHIKEHVVNVSAADDEDAMILVFVKQVWHIGIIGKMNVFEIASMQCWIFSENNVNSVFQQFAAKTFEGFPAHDNDRIGCLSGYLSEMGEVFWDVPWNRVGCRRANSTVFITRHNEFAIEVHLFVYDRICVISI
jgi:hypothetical protein